MASCVKCIVEPIMCGVVWCFCTATASLFGSCFGNDKPSTVPPSVTSGRKRSVLLLIIALACALGFQYGVAKKILDPSTYASYTPGYNYVKDAWTSGCTVYGNNVALTLACAEMNGAYRPLFAAMVFFALAAIAAYCKPTSNREAWPAKYALFLFFVAAMVFVPNTPLFNKIFLNLARIGGVFFILMQQFVIIDLAFNWNESWVAKADQCEQEEAGSGKKWLAAILVSCFILFGGAIIGLVFLFLYFTGCTTNNVFISLTLVFCIVLTLAQLSGEEGSLLSSACVCAWAVFLLHSAVSKNPDATCNPMLGEINATSIALGLGVTLLSMAWTGWSYTAEEKVAFAQRKSDEDVPALSEQKEEKSHERKVGGHVTGTGVGTDEATEGDYVQASSDDEAAHNDPKLLSNSWQLNLLLIFVTCWSAMVLTQWGQVTSDGTLANPSAGHVGMWMVIASQWIALTLYTWTLIASRLFPGRDFS